MDYGTIKEAHRRAQVHEPDLKYSTYWQRLSSPIEATRLQAERFVLEVQNDRMDALEEIRKVHEKYASQNKKQNGGAS